MCPPVTTQEIEGVHGIMTHISRNAPNMRLPRIAMRLSSRLNSAMPRHEYVTILQNASTRAQVKEFVADAGNRHRTSAVWHTMWQSELPSHVPKPPDVSESDRRLWLGSIFGDVSVASREFDKLVKELISPQLWLGRRHVGNTSAKGPEDRRWREIFRVVPSEETDMAFQAVRQPDMTVEAVSYLQERFVGSSVADLSLIDVLSITVSNGVLALVGGEAEFSKFVRV